MRPFFARRNIGSAALAALALCLFCAPAFAKKPPAEQPTRVFAAASLTDALTELANLYAAKGHPKPVYVFASSAILARQIDQGAKADLFISADDPWMDYAAKRKLIDPATRVSFLINKLVLIAPTDRQIKLDIKSGFDLKGALHGGKLAMGDPDSVPAGRYGRAALQNLGAWSAVSNDVVRADSVRAALRFVELGEAAAGIVYATDAKISQRVQVVGEFPQDSHPKISYPRAVVSGARAAEAKAYAAFLQSPKADAAFARHAFILEGPP